MVFSNIHKNCHFTHVSKDFSQDKIVIGKTNDYTADYKMGLSIPALLAKIKKMKASMTMNNKKYFSFKIVY